MDTKLNQADFERHEKALLLERDAKIDEIKASYKRKLDALAVLLEDARPKTKIVVLNQAKTVIDAVREAIRNNGNIQGNFTSVSLFTYVSKRYGSEFGDKPSALSNALWVLQKQDEIEPVEKGSGRRATIYKKTDTFGAPSMGVSIRQN